MLRLSPRMIPLRAIVARLLLTVLILVPALSLLDGQGLPPASSRRTPASLSNGCSA